MSNAKLAAARELIQEKQYTAARQILETMNDPTARRWLAQLDSIAPRSVPPPPPPPTVPVYAVSHEQEQYYRAENRRRRRRQIGNGIELIFMGIGCWIAYAFMNSIPKYTIPGSAPSSSIGLEIFLLPIGLIALIGGIIRLKRH